ncbi:MAG: hypothetical protein NC093_08440 [Alistipes sp.]|nr:hypothetical protein [Alistipes sp.]
MIKLRKAAAMCCVLALSAGCGRAESSGVTGNVPELWTDLTYFSAATPVQRQFYNGWKALAKDPVQELVIYDEPGAYNSLLVDDAMDAQLMLMLDEPEYSQILRYYAICCTDDSGRFAMTAVYDSRECPLEENIRRRDQAMAVIEEKARELGTLPTAEEKYRAAYDWLACTEYDFSESPPVSAHTIYGAAVKELSQCDGLAYTYTLVCREMGLSCYTAAGALGDSDHIWNIAPFEGEWRLIDITSGQDEAMRGDIEYLRFLCPDIYADGRKPLDNIKNIGYNF